jgi:uncharacterized repeat protein (TIGR01451 family)
VSDPPHWWEGEKCGDDNCKYPQWVWDKWLIVDIYECSGPINLAWENTDKNTVKSVIKDEGWYDWVMAWWDFYVSDKEKGWIKADDVADERFGLDVPRYHVRLWQLSNGDVVANAHHDTPARWHEADQYEEAEELVAAFFLVSDGTEWGVCNDSYYLNNSMSEPVSNDWCTQIYWDPIDITAPTKFLPALAGAYDNPCPIIVNLTVKEGTTPVTDLAKADFTFKIGGKVAASSLINNPNAGRYVFKVTPPKQDDAGRYDLEVILQFRRPGAPISWCYSKEKEEDAIKYTIAEHADVMLIVDRSGSMDWPSSKIEDAKESAKLFVDYMRDDDRAGVVSFASSASYNYHLNPLTAAIKIAIKNAIDGIYASGSTAMGAGLRYGLNDLTSLGDTDHSCAMVLLSDGYYNQGEHPNNVLPDIKALDIRVFTIGLGDDVDRTLLEHIATETGGEYYYAATSDQLREIYAYIVGKVVGWQTVLKRKAIIFLNQIIQIFVPIEDAFEAIFSISWGGSDLDLVLYKPDGTKIDPAVAATDPNIEYVKEATYTFYRVTDPDPGQWTMEVTGVDVPPEGEEFTATVKAISTLNLYLSTDKDQYNQDEVIKTIASITEGGLPITGAAVNADITLPDGSTESLSLFDDGGHGDIAANDGVFANYFTNTGQIGTYKIDASVTGTAPSGTLFSRQAETSVEVVAGQSLITLIPDTWNETVNASEKIEKNFNVSDPPTVGEKFIINKDLYAEYNGTHYLVYKESSIGGEPDYILSALPTTEKSFAAPNVSKWVLLTPTSLETPTGDLIDASNIILTPSTVQVPLNGSEKFNVSINIPSDAISGIYSGKIVATTIGGSDSIDLEITVIGIEGPVIKLKKTSSPNPVAPGGTVTYTINYTNSGRIDLTNVTLTENYPKGMTFISADPAPDAGTNNKWTLGTLPAGASGQIIIKMKVQESSDLTFTESGSVTGEGFVMVSKDLSTEQKPYSLKNVVTLSCAELAPVSASASTTVSGVPGTSLEITEHGSGIYSSDEILNLQTKNKSIMLQKSTEAEYQPTSFNFSDGFGVNFATKWTQDICARNIIMGDAMHKKIKDASYIKDETITEVGGYRTSMEFESSFYGAAHIGTVSKSAKTSQDYIGEFEITWAEREECRYLFNWSRVPGNDSEKLIQFLVDVLDIKWAENATITKSVDEMSINITDDGNTVTITIDENKKIATVKVGDEIIYVLEVRIEDDTLNIYDCKLEKMEESVSGIGYVMLDKDLASGQMQVREHGSGLYSSDMVFESGRLDKVTEAEYQPTSFNFSDDFAITFPSLWFQGICTKNIGEGTAIHKKISDASSMEDDTTATKSSMEFESSFNGSMHIGARTDGTRISEDYIGVFNITELIKIGKPAISTPSTPVPDWLPCPFPEPAVSTPPSDLECPSSDP